MLIFIIIGIGGLIACAYMTIDTFAFLDRTQVTEAIVVDFVRVGINGDKTDYPIYQFIDLNGVEVYARGTWNIDVNIGERVEIYYDPQNPTANVYAGGLAVSGPPLVLLVFGVSFAGVGLLCSQSYEMMSSVKI